MQAIYIVEDDENIRDLVVYALASTGFEAHGFEDTETFYKEISLNMPALVILDLMMPGEDGLSILKRLRQNPQTSNIPIIILTARSSEYDKVRGLDLGADDYVTKPFGVMELLSRIKAVLRRYKTTNITTRIEYKDLCIDLEKRLVSSNGENIPLTFKEFELLVFLLKNKGIVLSRNRIMEEVWGFDFGGETRTVDVHINTLRQKLGSSSAYIDTVRGVGYKIGD